MAGDPPRGLPYIFWEIVPLNLASSNPEQVLLASRGLEIMIASLCNGGATVRLCAAGCVLGVFKGSS